MRRRAAPSVCQQAQAQQLEGPTKRLCTTGSCSWRPAHGAVVHRPQHATAEEETTTQQADMRPAAGPSTCNAFLQLSATSTSSISQRFKCPVPGTTASCSSKTLGTRKSYHPPAGAAHACGLHAPKPQAAAAAAAAAAAGPTALVLYEPPAQEPGRSKVYADQFLVDQLRPHQQEGVKFIFECLTGSRQDQCFGAVLCDGMGLGKSFQSVASLWCLLTKGVDGKPTCGKPLILCPASLVQNWGRELVRWLGQRVQPVVVDDTRADAVEQCLQDFAVGGYQQRRQPKVLVMSYSTFRSHQAKVQQLGMVDIVICDEAHQLKNSSAQITQAVQSLPAKRRLLISGTPIQNDLCEFYTVITTALPGLLGDINAFRKQFEHPILRGRDADATPEQVAKGLDRMDALYDLCSKFMLRRTSAVLKALLPAKVEQVIFCKLAPLQLKLYQAFLRGPAVTALLSGAASGKGGRRSSSSSSSACGSSRQHTSKTGPQVAAAPAPEPAGAHSLRLAPLVAISALKKLCCHPQLIYRMCASPEEDQVAARPTPFAGAGPGTTAQGKAAAASGGSGRGAGARQQLHGFEGCAPLFHDHDVYPAFQPGQCQPYHSGKLMVLEALLKAIRTSEPSDKVVLISNFTEVLDVLQHMVHSKGWRALRLDGSCSIKHRQQLVDAFNSDPVQASFVFLVSSKAGGVGLNITGANRLILFDADWNPANDLQAMARVWREGQTKRVWIYRLLTAGSIEEKVFQRQLSKQGLSEAVVDEVGQHVRTFSADELRSLFKVDPGTACDTHAAIKCACDGSAAAAKAAALRAAGAAAGGAAGSAAGVDGPGAHAAAAQAQQGVAAWAHLASAADSPDPTMQHVGAWIRDKFMTWVFSDHVLNEPSPQLVEDEGDEPEPEGERLGREGARGEVDEEL